MNYSLLLFGKEEITELNYSDIVEYFKTEKQESDKIEFKAFYVHEKDKGGIEAKEKSILKSICGFLNSEGGILIWGAPKATEMLAGKGKSYIGEPAMVEKHYTKDDFIAKIANKITPSPKGIKFHSISKDDKYIYIIEIPQSEYSPHQFEHSYYMRLDGQTVHAPHHYVEALFKKISFPKLEAYLKIGSYGYSGNSFNVQLLWYFFNHSKFQNDYNLNYRVLCPEGKFDGWNTHTYNTKLSYDGLGHEVKRNNIKEIFHYGEPVEQSDIIVFNPYDLQKTNSHVEILLSFSARLSPMKFCHYKLNIDPNNMQDTDGSIIEMSENTYSNTIKERQGLSDVDVVNKILGRNKFKIT